MKTFFQELKNRRVYRVALAYVIVGSAAVQLAGTVFPVFHAPMWAQQVFVVFVAFGFPAALLMAWAFEMKGGAIKRTRSSRGARSGKNNRRPWILGVVGLLVAVAAVAAYSWWHPWKSDSGNYAVNSPPASERAALSPIPESSIAVLPFENLSDEKQNAYFADGVHDEVLRDLAKVAGLKVISRTSVMQYKSGVSRNLREIAKELGVAHVLEGTVQRVGGRVRVSAQLIDARTDAHLWAERYDRDLADVFGIESEVAEQIVAQLKIKLSPAEKAAIEERPTADLVAYELYLRAKVLARGTSFSGRGTENLLEAAGLLDNAVQRDPGFYLAYYELAAVHDRIYFLTADHTPARLALAETAVKNLVRLRPEAGETHLAKGQHLYRCCLDYDGARAELKIASATLPNDPLICELNGYMDRRQGRWSDSTRNLERALELDPRNVFVLQQISLTYQNLRRFADTAAVLDRALKVAPDDIDTQVARAQVDFYWRGDLQPLSKVIGPFVRQNPGSAEKVNEAWLLLSLCQRDFSQAERALAAIPPDGINENGVGFPRAWCEGLIARTRGDETSARAAFTVARAKLGKIVEEQPTYAKALAVLGMIDAGLGRKEDAIREGRQAVELLPVSKDALNGAYFLRYLAVIYTWTGENNLAIQQLEMAARIPGDVTYGQLHLHPYWDPLRNDPQFAALVARMAPKEAK